jgi:hypothetical protein
VELWGRRRTIDKLLERLGERGVATAPLPAAAWPNRFEPRRSEPTGKGHVES